MGLDPREKFLWALMLHSCSSLISPLYMHRNEEIKFQSLLVMVQFLSEDECARLLSVHASLPSFLLDSLTQARASPTHWATHLGSDYPASNFVQLLDALCAACDDAVSHLVEGGIAHSVEGGSAHSVEGGTATEAGASAQGRMGEQSTDTVKEGGLLSLLAACICGDVDEFFWEVLYATSTLWHLMLAHKGKYIDLVRNEPGLIPGMHSFSGPSFLR